MKMKNVISILACALVVTPLFCVSGELDDYRLCVHVVEGVPDRVPDVFPVIGTNYFLVNIAKSYPVKDTFKSWIRLPAVGQLVEVDGHRFFVSALSSDHTVLVNTGTHHRINVANLLGSCNAWMGTNNTVHFTAKTLETAEPTGPRDGARVGVVFKKAQVDVVAAFYFDLTGNKVEVEPGVYATVSLRTEEGVTKGEAVRLVEEALREQNVGLFPKAPNLFAARWIDPAIRPQGPPFGVSSSTSSVPSTTTNSHTRMSHITRRAERERTRKGSKGLAQQTNVVHKATTQPSGTNSPIHPILNPEQVGTELRTDSLPGSFPQK